MLAGGFCPGDRVTYDGVPATVLGPSARKSAVKVSVSIRFDSNGHLADVRANLLQRALAGGSAERAGDEEVEPQPLPAVQIGPLSPDTGSFILDPLRQRRHPRLVYDAPPPQPAPMRGVFNPPPRGAPRAPPPQTVKQRACDDILPKPSFEYPTQNFITHVIQKNPHVDEPDAPDTQTILRTKADYHKMLPEDPLERQRELIRLYTMETQLYPQVNLALRQDDPKRLAYFGAYIKELRDCFLTDNEDQIITPFKGTVWRGVTVPDVKRFLEDFQPEAEFVWESFTSTSTDKQIARIFGNVLFEIHCRDPVTGTFDDETPEYAPADIKEFSDTKEETEILFPPNVRFRVITVQMPSGGLGGLSVPLVICETMGYDSIWGLIHTGNYDAVQQWCHQHPHLVEGDKYNASILHAAIDSGDHNMAHAVLQTGANPNQVCPVTGKTAYQKLNKQLAYKEETAFENPEDPVPLVAIPDNAGIVSGMRFKARPNHGFAIREALAGGFFLGDQVLFNGKTATVIGPAARRACANVSVGIRFDSGAIQDARVALLQLVNHPQVP